MLRAISRTLLSSVFPLSCELCGGLLPPASDGALCSGCEESLPVPTGPAAEGQAEHFHFDRVFAAGAYEGGLKKLLRAFKFGRRRPAGADLVRLLEKRLGSIEDRRWELVAAVPMPGRLRRERGFNQADVLARGVACSLRLPFVAGALGIQGSPKQQSRLSRLERRENVRRRFFASPEVRDRHALLVDDVLTTGQTASECARSLKDAGARSVDVLVVARGR